MAFCNVCIEENCEHPIKARYVVMNSDLRTEYYVCEDPIHIVRGFKRLMQTDVTGLAGIADLTFKK